MNNKFFYFRPTLSKPLFEREHHLREILYRHYYNMGLSHENAMLARDTYIEALQQEFKDNA